MRPSKTQRWLDLIAFLAGRRFLVTAEEIMERVPGYLDRHAEPDEVARESARRKFERDKDELRGFGIPIRREQYKRLSSNEELDGYRLESTDFYLPYLRLVQRASAGTRTSRSASVKRGAQIRAVEIDPDVIALAVVGLRRVADVPGFPLAREARSALRKLTFDLDPSTVFDTRVVYALPPGEEPLSTPLQLLLDGLLRRKTVSFTYRGMYRDQEEARTVRPYGLLFQHAHWYLIAYDESREGIRVFRVVRMSEIAVNARRPNTEDYRIPPEFEMSAYANRKAWALGEEDGEALEARVRFAYPRSLWAERNQMGTLLDDHPDGASTRAFRVVQAEPFVRWLLSLEGDALLESPPELRALFDDAVRQLARLYQVDGSHG
jgi:predicted DNA-binding transcriptional regulator YafY